MNVILIVGAMRMGGVQEKGKVSNVDCMEMTEICLVHHLESSHMHQGVWKDVQERVMGILAHGATSKK